MTPVTYNGNDSFAYSMRVYQTVSIHLIRQASPATFPVQGKVFGAVVVRRIRSTDLSDFIRFYPTFSPQ